MYDNMIWNDSSYSSVVSKFTNYSSTYTDVAEILKNQISELISYAAQDPAVSYSGPEEGEVSSALQSICDAVDSITGSGGKLETVKGAISDYSDGVWDNQNYKNAINDILGGTNPSSSPSGGSSGGSGGGNSNSSGVVNSNGDNKLEMTPNEENVTITGKDDSNKSFNVDDENIVLPENIVSSLGSNGTVFGTTESSLIPELDSDNLSDEIVDSNIVDSASSFSSAIFPSMTSSSSTKGVLDSTKSAGVVGAIGLSVSAAAALGGKVYYDSKKDNSLEEEELLDDDSELDDLSDDIFDNGDETVEEKAENEKFNSLKLKDEILKI